MIRAPLNLPTNEQQWQRYFNQCYVEANQVKSFTVATLPDATQAGQMIYVSNESGGAVLAFSDGTNWRRSTDRAIVS